LLHRFRKQLLQEFKAFTRVSRLELEGTEHLQDGCMNGEGELASWLQLTLTKVSQHKTVEQALRVGQPMSSICAYLKCIFDARKGVCSMISCQLP
jgi:hypothetical protein